jgi:hypothetical protein
MRGPGLELLDYCTPPAPSQRREIPAAIGADRGALKQSGYNHPTRNLHRPHLNSNSETKL